MDSVEAWMATRRPEARHDTLVPMGEVVGTWHVVALLGKGGQGEVYRVLDVRTKMPAALKIRVSDGESRRRHFRNECDALQTLRLPCLPRFFGRGEWHGHDYVVMEELDDFELPHGNAAVARFILAVCKAVGALHAHGYVHRDLKPANILRRKDGSYVLIDLGLLKRVEKGAIRQWQNKPSMVGTEGYSAPEQLLEGQACVRSDIHAIGVIVDACFKGKPNLFWARLIEKSTSSIPSRRYRSIQELVRGVVLASLLGRVFAFLCFPMAIAARLPFFAPKIFLFSDSNG